MTEAQDDQRVLTTNYLHMCHVCESMSPVDSVLMSDIAEYRVVFCKVPGLVCYY